MTKTLANPHDRFFKELFSRRETARDFVQHYLPPEIVKLLNLPTLEICKDSFVEANLSEHFSDVLYKVTLQNGQPTYIYLLFDHKSYADSLVSFQLLRYMVRVWDLWLKQERKKRKGKSSQKPLKLPMIIPMVVYHGEASWNVSTELAGLFNLSPEFEQYVPNYQYQLYDLSDYQDDQIIGQVMLQVGLLILKHIHDERLGEHLVDILKLLRNLHDQPTALAYLETLLRYVSSGSSHLTEADLAEVLHEVLEDETGGEIMPTLVEQWLERGRQEGIAFGRQEGIAFGRQEGIAFGRQEGIAFGMAEGMAEGLIKAISRILVIRFDSQPDQYAKQLKRLPWSALDKLNETALKIGSLAEFETALAEQVSQVDIPPKNMN